MSEMMKVLATAAVLAVATSAQASVEISSKPTHNMNCTGGVCTPTAKNADLNANDLANMLASGDVKVVTGAGAVTITVSQSFSWTSTHRLTLDANLNVSFRAPVEVAGKGAVTIVTNDGGTSGDLHFFPGASLDFWDLSSNLIVNHTKFKLVNDIATLASDIAARHGGAYALAKSYDASVDGTYSASPVPAFEGVFEGLGHEFANVTIAVPREHTYQYAGLFLKLTSGALVRDIGLSNFHGTAAKRRRHDITLSGFGPLTGLLEDSTVRNCFATGSISGQRYDQVGELIGELSGGAVARSSSSAAVNGQFGEVGGLVGDFRGTSSKIIQSHASGVVAGGAMSGGLVGSAQQGRIIESSATGMVSSDLPSSFVGGLVGFSANGGTIELSFATGTVRSHLGSAGGIAGWEISGAKIENSYAAGAVSDDANGNAGGLVGYMQDTATTIATSYSTGLISSGGNAGGLLGYDNDRVGPKSDAYWDLDTSGIGDPAKGAGNVQNDPGITGLTDAQLKSGLPSGFDPNVWGQSASINNGYPYLLANPPPQ